MKFGVKNNYKGKFIVFEGIDGSGKSTQTKLLEKSLEEQGYKTERIDFPQHGEKSAGLVDEYLTGKYGVSEKVGPHIASIFYACDRYDASFKIRKWIDEKKIVISDRYVVSNIGHQGGKIESGKDWKKYVKWLYNLEYKIFKIPKPDYTFILKTSPEYSLKLAHNITDEEKKARRKSYLGNEKRDIHEKDGTHLRKALDSYLKAAKEFPKEFKVIECIENGKLLNPEVINEKVLKIIKKIL